MVIAVTLMAIAALGAAHADDTQANHGVASFSGSAFAFFQPVAIFA